MSENNKKVQTEAQYKFNTLKREDKSLADKELDLDELISFYKKDQSIMVPILNAHANYAGYIKVFEKTVDDYRLSDGAFRTYCKLLCYVNPNPKLSYITDIEKEQGIAYPTRKTLAEQRHTSERTIGRHVNELVNLNYTVVKNSNNSIDSQNRYLINALVDINLSKENRELKKKLKEAEDKIQQQQKEINDLKTENINRLSMDPDYIDPSQNFEEDVFGDLLND